MSISSTVLFCYGAIPELDEASIRPTRDPPPGRAGDWAEATVLLVQDRDRIAGGINDLVVHRLFAAGLALETALGLIGGHPGAGKVREAIGELDLAIRDVRNTVQGTGRPPACCAPTTSLAWRRSVSPRPLGVASSSGPGQAGNAWPGSIWNSWR